MSSASKSKTYADVNLFSLIRKHGESGINGEGRRTSVDGRRRSLRKGGMRTDTEL
jgi:hypothetical protein